MAWSYTPKRRHHVLTVAYSKRNARFFGVELPIGERGPKTLLRFEEECEPVCVRDIGKPFPFAHVFCWDGDYLLTSFGELMDLRDGSTVRQLRLGSRFAR
jgi:hypothetical protein